MKKSIKTMALVLLFMQTVILFAQQKKNILFIAVDDLKPNIGVFGDEDAITPNMDKLGEMGFVFNNAYTQQAVCGPSRASMLTGWYPDRTKVWDLHTLIRDKNPDVVTLPQYFKQNGYITYATGKIFDPRSVDRKYDPVSWSIPYRAPHQLHNSGPEPVLGSYQSEKHRAEYQTFVALANARGLTGKKKMAFLRKNYKPSTEKADVPDDYYYDGRIANDALKRIDEFADKDKPFLLMVGFKKPHLPFVAPSKYWDLYDPDKLNLAKWQRHSKGGPSIAYHNNGELRSYTDIPAAFDDRGLLDREKQRELIHGYYAAASYIDTQIGKLLDRLKEKGLLDNTIIVLWGDHGWHLGDHGLWCKHTNFEQATRLPLIIYDPGKKPGKTTIPVETLDIYPTLCDLAGIPREPTLQGTTLVPFLEGKEPQKKFAVSQWPVREIDGMGYTIRTERYRYTEWYKKFRSTQQRDPKNLVASELYDYQEDPLETKNLAKNKNYKEVATEMRQLLHNWMAKQVGTAMVTTSLLDNEKPGEPNGTPLKVLVKKNFEPGQVYIGSTVAYSYLKTPAAQLLAQQFSYTTPENAAKQSAVHPEPGVWRWKKINDIIKFAEANNITVRLHGPVSPQASKWAKQDNRTPEELDKIMEEYMVEQCKKFNGNKVVKWMDVVNETVNRDGTWFGPKPGVDLWENPWLQIGMNDDGIPKYIVKAFEIANRYAPDIKLVYNQHGGMEPEMWEKVKSVILYLKKQGLRVDGIGWQAHLQSDEELAFNQKDLDYFAGLIDWAHANGLEFHVTEIDYKIKNPNVSSADLKKQAVAYANILKVLLSRRNTGVVTYNTWGLKDGVQKYHNQSRFIFDKDLRAKPAYYALQKVLSNPDDLMPDYSYDKKDAIDDGINKIQNGGFEKGMKSWISFGEIEVVSDGSQKSGESCIRLNADRSGVKQKVKVKRNTDYLLTAWLKSENNEKVRFKVMMSKENQVGKVITDADYTKVTLKFNSGDFKEIVVAFTKWNSGNGKAWADDFYLKEDKK